MDDQVGYLPVFRDAPFQDYVLVLFFEGQRRTLEVEAQFGLGRDDRLFHSDHARIGLSRRRLSTRWRRLAILQSPVLTGSRQEHGVDLPAMQCAVDAESSAPHGAGSHQHGALARTKNLGQSEDDMLGFQVPEA